MPAAAVIPAPIAYIKVVAVKKLVVEFLTSQDQPCVERRGVLALDGRILSRDGSGLPFTGRVVCALDLLL